MITSLYRHFDHEAPGQTTGHGSLLIHPSIVSPQLTEVIR